MQESASPLTWRLQPIPMLRFMPLAAFGLLFSPAEKKPPSWPPLPVYLLGGSPEFARTMDLWGIRTFGEFAKLPSSGVTARLSKKERSFTPWLAARARGSFVCEPMRRCSRKNANWTRSTYALELLLFVISGMLRDVCARLQFHAYSTNEIRLRLKLERACEHHARLQLPVPMLNTKVLVKLLHLELSGRPPHAPVEKIHLEAMPTEPRTTQHGLFVPSAPEPEKLEITLARIRGLWAPKM